MVRTRMIMLMGTRMMITSALSIICPRERSCWQRTFRYFEPPPHFREHCIVWVFRQTFGCFGDKTQEHTVSKRWQPKVLLDLDVFKRKYIQKKKHIVLERQIKKLKNMIVIVKSEKEKYIYWDRRRYSTLVQGEACHWTGQSMTLQNCWALGLNFKALGLKLG